MPVPLDFLHSVGTHALPILAGTAAVAAELGSSILGKVWEWWGKKAREEERRKELETLAGMTSQQVKEAVREVTAQLAKDQPPVVQSKLEGYLMAVPAQIRRTLRRPTDAAGLTVPPDLRLSKAEDLAPLLPPRPPRFTPGDKAPGTDFELVELLGIGGFGEVWKARNTYMPGASAVALKFCLDPDAAASLRRETSLLDRIQREGKHPGIVELRNTFLSADPPYLEYELVEGGDLGGLIHDWHREKGGPNPDQAARVLRRLAEIVAFAHAKNIVHRDLKPANILLRADRGPRSAEQKAEDEGDPGPSHSAFRVPRSALKVADFGIGGIAAEAAARQARLTHGGTLTAAAAHGSYSLYYASPEQMRGAFPDPRDDVHALGVIWYQMLVGDLTAEAPRGAGWKKRLAAKGMSAPLVELLESCVASDREDRPADAGEVAERVAFLLADPAPDIDLAFAPAKSPEPVAAPRQPLAPPVVLPQPTISIVDHNLSRVAVESALRKARWLDFVNRLREIRLGHERLRWASGLLCWLTPLALLVGLAAGAGAGVFQILDDEARDRNRQLGSDIAAQYSTSNPRIEWQWSYRSGYFRLWANTLEVPIEPPRTRAEAHRSQYHTISLQYPSYTYSSGESATYYPVSLSGIVPANARERPSSTSTTRTRRWPTRSPRTSGRAGKKIMLYSFVAGTTALVLLLVGFLFLRRWKWRTLEANHQNAIATTEAEYAPELRDLPGPLDLNQRDAINRLVKALEGADPALKPLLPSPARLVHRLIAPF